MKDPSHFFDFAAEVGLTKHIGGVEATRSLLELCAIDAGKVILDVGCGVGATPCFIAREYGCRVVGIDILERMVERSRERAEREGLSGRVEFRVADVQHLPFEDARFDAVITESVIAFPEDKQQAVNELARVTKPGGAVGLNETTWLKAPPPPEMVAWAAQDVGANVMPLTAAEWVGLLEAAGLSDIVAQTYAVNLKDESKGIVQRYGRGGMMAVLGRMLSLYFKSPAYRAFVKEIKQGGLTPKGLEDYFGYGIFVGRK